MAEETFVRKASDVDERKSKGGVEFPPLPEPLEVAIYDNHTHLEFQFVDELEPLSVGEHLDKAQSVGIKSVVQVGVTLESSKWSAGLAEREPRVLAAVAIHPNEAPLYETNAALDSAVAEIAQLAAKPRVRAIGETGLDYFRTEGEKSIELQRRSFEQQIEIAKQNDIALMIHDRDAHADVVETLKRVGSPDRVVFHCYSGDVELAEICAENGWYMSFAGNITIKRNQHLRDSLKFAPKELILIETDAPFLAPEPYRGRPNTSYLVPITARFMAEVRETEVNQLCEQLALNTEAVYGQW